MRDVGSSVFFAPSKKENDMFCSRSVGVHLLKGAGALVLIILALYLGAYQETYILPPVLFIGAFLLFRGCPMCWLVGLFETIANRKAHNLEVKNQAAEDIG